MTSLPARVLIAPIRFYQRFITPYTPATCRYYPTCSAYAVTALRTHGAAIGTVLTVWRLLRCNPWSSGGIDHVPPKGRVLHHPPPAEVPNPTRCGDDHNDHGRHDDQYDQYDQDDHGERGEAAASSTTVCSAGPRSADADNAPPPPAARQPMIGRSAA